MLKKSNIQVTPTTQHIVNWLKNYATSANSKGFVVGISGGIDSALTSTLCALTGLKTLCVEIPIHQHHAQVDRVKEHIQQLKKRFSNVESVESDMTQTFDTFVNHVEKTTDEAKRDLTLANTRARLRMTTLYYYAGIHGLLVAGTGNKIEDFGVGFFTKYGDGGVDISPIADLLKSDVRALAAHLEVPSSILNAAPTDGLFGNDRTDEDQLGASYDELEWAMEAVQKEISEDMLTERELEVLTIYKRLNRINQHKIVPIPVCEIPESFR